MIVKCAGCEAQIDDGAGRPGVKRKWCSDKCRKRTLYSGECIDCGGRTDGVASGYARESTRCLNCARTVKAERNERIFVAWEEGEPAWYIAEREGTTATAVLSIVDHHRRLYGGAISLHRRRSREAWPELIRLRKAGLTNPEIAERLDTNTRNVWEMFSSMQEAGEEVPPSPYLERAEERAQQIVDLWADGLTVAEIGEEIGWAMSSVGSRISQLRVQGYDLPYRRKVAA